jgi:hypothetical protein
VWEGSGGASAGVAGSVPKGGSSGKGGSGNVAGAGGSDVAGGGGTLVAGSGGNGGTAGFDNNVSGAAGVQVEIRPATPEEDSIPEGCEFTFAPPNGTGGSGGTAGQSSGGAGPAGAGNVAGDGAGGDSGDSTAGSSGTSGSADPPLCGCTRRPGPGTSFQCPWGEGLTVSTQIGPDGGTIQLQGTESTVGMPLEVRIPRGALADTVTISVTELSVPPPDELHDWSPLYRFEPSTLEFLRPVEVRVPWSGNSGLVAGLSLYVSSEPGGSCDMKPLSDNFVSTGFNQGTLWHLGWAIVGVPKPDGCP